MELIPPINQIASLNSCLVALTLMLAGSPAQSQQAPICPSLESVPYPPYGKLGEAPMVEVWRGIDLQNGADCFGSVQGPMALVVAISSRFKHLGSIEDIASRIGAISSTEGLVYWSTNEDRWRVLISEAFALEEQSVNSVRPDFTVKEILSGRTLYFAQDDTRSTGPNIYTLTVQLTGAGRLSAKIINLTPIRFMFITLFEPRSLLSAHFIKRLGPDVWGYYGLSAVRGDSTMRHEKISHQPRRCLLQICCWRTCC